MGYSLEELQRDSNNRREALKKKMRDNYKLAKELGFSSAEASVLANKSEDIIRQLALQMNNKDKK